MSNFENGEIDQPLTIEEVAQQGLYLAQSGEYEGVFQEILDMAGAGLDGKPPSPEGLMLKALYHQSYDDSQAAEFRAESAIQEIAYTYRHESGPQATPVVLSGLALLLSRATRPIEQEFIANALEAAGEKLSTSGYVFGQ